MNLRDRLQRIQQMQQSGEVSPLPKPVSKQTSQTGQDDKTSQPGQNCLPEWETSGYQTQRRDITVSEKFLLPQTMPETACAIMPGIAGSYENLLFFDLETTGLSGGAGTVAFLAAFGRLFFDATATQTHAVYSMKITQYLLLDYPGEYDFIKALLGEFNDNTVVVSYNGKTFDSQILKTRCLMNGIQPPEYRHADLLHPSRRLWKRLLPDCSQGTIETGILCLDRTCDIPGALAPDIWFSFLKNGETDMLLGICEHNRRDITGLAAIFCAIAAITHNPIAALEKTQFDIESLSLRLRNIDLLRYAAEKAATGEYPPLRPITLRALAIDSEHKRKKLKEALAFAEQGLDLLPSDSVLKKDFIRRIERLRKKEK